ncbi:MAG: FG-GAP-like repeat-containing protein [Planctomycetota bacterium]
MPALFSALILGLCLAQTAPPTPPTPAAPSALPAPTTAAGRARAQAGDHEGAVAILQQVVAGNAADGPAWYQLGYSLHALGRHAEALPAHERAATFPAFAAGGGYNAACALALLGRREEALARLAAAVRAGFGDRNLLASDTDLDSLRADPRFATLLPARLDGAAAFAEPVRVLYTLVGKAGNEEFGWVTRAVGDLDGDGATDFASTAPGHGGGLGRVDVHSGRTGALLFSRAGQPGWRLGNSVAGGADVNGDGTPDVVAGAPNANRALVWSGRDGAVLHELSQGTPGEQFGLKVALLEDLDDDGRAEIAVTAWRADGGRGAVTVFAGATGAVLFRLTGSGPADNFGSALDATRAGGHHLLAVGVSGALRCDVFRCTPTGAEKIFDMRAGPNGSNLGQYFVSFLGDTNGDGVPDVYASDWQDSGGTGRVYVHSGASGERLLDLPGAAPGEQFGTSAAVCGDADGDGHADLIVGAWQSAAGAASGGRCALHSGQDGRLLATWTDLQSGDTLGFDAVGLGDVDADGQPEFLLSAAWSLVDFAKQGRVFVVSMPRASAR